MHDSAASSESQKRWRTSATPPRSNPTNPELTEGETRMTETLPEVVTESDWLIARKALLEREKQLTKLKDAVNAERRRLPMVRIDKDYVFTGPHGQVSLLDLFDGRKQLVMHHLMFAPDWAAACPS